MEPLVVFDRVSFQYESGEGSPIPALENVSLSIDSGEFVAVIGANGSGKSTFARLVNGLLLPTSGKVRVNGIDTQQVSRRSSIHTSVGMVFQFPEDQIISTTVEEDVAFGPGNLGMPPAEIRSRVDEALERVGMEHARHRPPHLLSAGQIQRVALAGVLAMRPRCIVFDEASTMLDPAGRRMLDETLLQLKREGVTVILITHFMEEASLADRVIVFHRGRVALDGTPEQVFSDSSRLSVLRLDLPPLARAAGAVRAFFPELPPYFASVADLLSVLPEIPRDSGSLPRQKLEHPSQVVGGSPLVEVSGLGYVYMRGTPLAQRALEKVSLQVGQGEAHGLIGRTGSGKSTLMQHLNGLLRPQEGSVRVGEFLLNDPQVDRRAVVRKAGLVFQNPETQFFEYYVGDEIAYGPRQLKVEEPLAERVRWAMEQVGLDFMTYKDRPLFHLSGGERRKVALASTLALKPSILLLDEPTAGLDPASRRDLLDKLLAMRQAGLTLVLSSHQMGDLARIARRLTVFHSGQTVLEGSTAEVFAQRDVLRGYGIEPPVAAQVAAALREKGWPLPMDVMTAEALHAEIAGAIGREPV